ALIATGLSALVTAMIAVVRGHLDWAQLTSRRAGGWAATGATAVVVVGGLLASTTAAGTGDGTVTQASTPSATAGLTTGPPPTTTSAIASTTATTTTSATGSDPLSAAIASASGGLALAALGHLPVKAAAARTGYARKAFGQAWADVDRNGCDTRSDVLRGDLSRVVIKAGTHGCAVASGTAIDPYTGKTLTYRYGSTTVSVDHVVSLADMWVSGARQWTAAKRLAFANDPLNLSVVATSVNKAKGDRNAAAWLPPRTSYRCRYVARQVAVKSKYGASVAPAERAAIGRILIGCNGQELPRTADVQAVPARATTYYATCSAARAAGATPLRSGRPGYRAGLDGDHDGVACE
ncbi:MAG TPA: DUF1524 domain-containing protein, partial [Kineosporiaceae bacterium]|nr:DUF1524 domain-containing protein [Kineosporiaceae bacterium]